MDALLLVVGLVIVIALTWEFFFRRKAPSPYGQRSCQGRGWRTAFPDASKQEIRAFLELVVSAFQFNESEKLKFGPSDKISDIYRKLNPSRWLPDSLELETLAQDLEATYGIDLEALWSDALTLGELFALTKTSSQVSVST